MLKKLLIEIYHYFLILRSGFFDQNYYLRTCPDVRKADIDPLWHFVRNGWKEERDPSAKFNTRFYLENYPDVLKEKINPFYHYIRFGKQEGREPLPTKRKQPISDETKLNDFSIENLSSIINNQVPEIRNYPVIDREKISVVVTTYNHERYIKQCLDSIIKQKGDFNIEIIVGDDCSTDKTLEIIRDFKSEYPDFFRILPTEQNLGVTKNLKRCLDVCSGKYIAICEGDDYWIDEYKLQKQMDFLSKNDHFSMVFSSIILLFEDKNMAQFNFYRLKKDQTQLTTEELIENNHIGNFSCCMYKSKIVKVLPNSLFNLYTVDWMFNIACSEKGKVGYLHEYQSVYRIHELGVWSGKSNIENLENLLESIDEYNAYYDYRYNESFLKHKNRIMKNLSKMEELIK